jgi:hypothetical protein
MSQDAKALIRRYYDAFNRDPESAFAQYVADEELKQHSRARLGAFPNSPRRASSTSDHS